MGSATSRTRALAAECGLLALVAVIVLVAVSVQTRRAPSHRELAELAVDPSNEDAAKRAAFALIVRSGARMPGAEEELERILLRLTGATRAFVRKRMPRFRHAIDGGRK